MKKGSMNFSTLLILIFLGIIIGTLIYKKYKKEPKINSPIQTEMVTTQTTQQENK